MNVLQRLFRAILWGGLSGIVTLVLDQLLAFLTLGFFIAVTPRFIAVHALVGALVAILVEATLLLRRRRQCDAPLLVTSILAIVYGASIFERVDQAFALRIPRTLSVVTAVAAILGYVVWILLMRRFLASGAAASRAAPQALVVAVLCVAVGLAVNRNLVSRPLEPAALAADALIMAVGLVLLLTVRFGGPRRAAGLVAALTAVALLAVTLEPWKAGAPAQLKPRDKPHLVLVLIDTLRQDVFRSVVDTTEEGRALRQAVGKAAWFDNAVSVAPWTAPSVASIMTGLFPPEHGFGAKQRSRNRPLKKLARSTPTLAEHLRSRGYRTMGIVTNPLLHSVSGIARGFQSYEFLGGATTKLPLLTVLARARLVGREFYQGAGSVRRRLRHRLGELTASQRPVFLWLHLMDPHYPLHGHPELPDEAPAADLPEDERFYREETRYALREVARMVEMLKASGLWDDAVFVLLSDHGEMFASDAHDHLPPHKPKVYGHGHALYNELVKVPLVIRPPGGLPEERRVDAMTSHADLHDTLFDVMGLDVPRIARDRVSLVPWLGPEPPGGEVPRRAYTLIGANQVGPEQRAVTTEDFKLIEFVNGDLPEELYELTSDPREERNLASVDVEMRAELEELLAYTWGQLAAAAEGKDVELNEETRQRLKALGYIE